MYVHHHRDTKLPRKRFEQMNTQFEMDSVYLPFTESRWRRKIAGTEEHLILELPFHITKTAHLPSSEDCYRNTCAKISHLSLPKSPDLYSSKECDSLWNERSDYFENCRICKVFRQKLGTDTTYWMIVSPQVANDGGFNCFHLPKYRILEYIWSEFLTTIYLLFFHWCFHKNNADECCHSYTEAKPFCRQEFFLALCVSLS